MEVKQQKIFVWAGAILLAVFAINKLKNSLGFGNTFDPNKTEGLSTVWNDSTTSHANYSYKMHSSAANDLSEYIYSQLGAFTDNFTNIFTAIKQCQTKGDIYQICQFFKNNYDAGLWQSLINGYGAFPWSGLSSDQLKELNDYANSLPN